MNTITLCILLPWALWPKWSIKEDTQHQICCCEDGLHWLDSCFGSCFVCGYIFGTLNGGQMTIWSFLEGFKSLLGVFWSVLISFWCFVILNLFYCILVIFIHKGLYWEFKMLRLIVEMFIFRKGTVVEIGLCIWLLICIILLVVWYLCPVEVILND